MTSPKASSARARPRPRRRRRGRRGLARRDDAAARPFEEGSGGARCPPQRGAARRAGWSALLSVGVRVRRSGKERAAARLAMSGAGDEGPEAGAGPAGGRPEPEAPGSALSVDLPGLLGQLARSFALLLPVYALGYLGMSFSWVLLALGLLAWCRRSRVLKASRVFRALALLEDEERAVRLGVHACDLPAWVSLVRTLLPLLLLPPPQGQRVGDSGFSPSEVSAPLAPNLGPIRGPHSLDPDQVRSGQGCVCVVSHCCLPAPLLSATLSAFSAHLLSWGGGS